MFLWYLLWGYALAAGGKSYNIVGASLWLGPLEFLILRLACMKPPAISQLWFRFSYPGASSCGGFYLWVSASVSCASLYLPFCLILRSVVCPVPFPLFWIQEDLLIPPPICLAFYLLEWSGDFQAPYMQNQKLEFQYIYSLLLMTSYTICIWSSAVFMNKHLSVCCIHLVNFQNAEMVILNSLSTYFILLLGGEHLLT